MVGLRHLVGAEKFCSLIGARSSLTSGYHPEANGQTELATENRPQVPGFPESLYKEQTPGLGRICQQFTGNLNHRVLILQLCIWILSHSGEGCLVLGYCFVAFCFISKVNYPLVSGHLPLRMCHQSDCLPCFLIVSTCSPLPSCVL